MVNDYIDMETIHDYIYEGKEYYLEIFYTEDESIKVFASFQIDVTNDSEDMVGVGEDNSDRNKAILKAIEHLHSQLN